jgi:glucose 1-dehydrogenase
MRAITVAPGVANSTRLEEIPAPALADGVILARTLALGVCGTDRDIASGQYGWAPPGRSRLVLGHESLGRVERAPESSSFSPGELVVGIVRRPDPVPCPACAVGEWDMCRNGRYTERGIKERDGFGAEWFGIEPDFAVKVDPALDILGVLLEPASIVAKAWDHTERIGRRSKSWHPKTLVVTGAGPIGLLAALMGAQRGFDVHVLNHHASELKSSLVRALGGTFHTDLVALLSKIQPDVLMECTGAPVLIRDVLAHTASGGIICLTGVTAPGHALDFDVGLYNRTMVLNNDLVFGTVNANRTHYEMAARAIARADRSWLAQLITRRVPLEKWSEALQHRPDDIKVIIEFSS